MKGSSRALWYASIMTYAFPLALVVSAILGLAGPTRAEATTLTVFVDANNCLAPCTFNLCLVGHGNRKPDVNLCPNGAPPDVIVTAPAYLTPRGRSSTPKRFGPMFSVGGRHVLLRCFAPEACFGA